MNTSINGRLFEWDDEDNRLNQNRHGLSLSTGALIFADNNRLEQYDFYSSFRCDRWKASGVISGIALVVFSDREDFSRILSARKATDNELNEYGDINLAANNFKPTDEQLAELTAQKNRFVTLARGCMTMPDELMIELARMREKFSTRRITKELWQTEHPDGDFSVTYADGKVITYDEDCMSFPEELSDEQFRIMRKHRTRRLTKELWYAEHPDGSFEVRPENSLWRQTHE